MNSGFVVVGGQSFPILSVRLEKGKILVTFKVIGPYEPFSGKITVFGEDGRGIWQGKTWEFTRSVAAGQAFECEYGLTITSVGTRDQSFAVN